MTTPVIGNLEPILTIGLTCLLISLALLSYRQRHAARRLLRLSDWRATAFAVACGFASTFPLVVEHPLPWQMFFCCTAALLCGVMEIRDNQRLLRGSSRPPLEWATKFTAPTVPNTEQPPALGNDGEVDRSKSSH